MIARTLAPALTPALARTLALALALALAVPATSAPAQEAYLQPPAVMDASGRCDYFSRLYRFTEQSKSLCDDGHQVKLGPVTTRVLDQCRRLQGERFARVPVTDMMDALGRQVERDGLGNACHEIGAQVWDLLAQ